MRKEYMTHLKSIINHYDMYKKIAVPLKWEETRTAYCDASQYRREIYLRLYTVQFRKGYLQTNFAEAFVQTMLTMMAYTEEWELDFWAHITPEERLNNLVKGQSFFSEYFCFERLCMQPMTAEELRQDVHSWFPWAETQEELKTKHAFRLPDEAHSMFTDFSRAEAMCLGGLDGCTPDENWLAIQDDAFLFIAFHCSG